MFRTSIVLPPVLHQQLSMLAHQEGKKLSEFLREQLRRIADQEQNSQLDDMYKAIGKMKGLIKDKVTDASTTIDEVLYGEQGVWRGTPTQHGLWQMPKRKRRK
jgi:hypothetical protein